MTALRRTTAALRRLEAARARMDTRDQALARRQRTRQLIELGGLVVKSGL
ncbi:conjugal transfer protein TraD, partial [Roseovarius mucosus]|nr:conjugal transfer protein TraD [Roseovarius mucosus]